MPTGSSPKSDVLCLPACLLACLFAATSSRTASTTTITKRWLPGSKAAVGPED
ncbi:uncharacterized protein TrAFT101_010380 [Trichoderma asperellum]|uniref:uncharacterized protein n=1 Tax=Trichoderma asperellum TaxID=101201 RepID=UPI0033233324|nr:hypothetical protein TrAFT101_010380 [Trichoderma asperellum]